MEIALWSTALIAAVMVAGAFSWSSSERRIVRMERRLGVVESKLDALLEHLGVPAEPGFHEVDAFLREGKKLHAIKAYRDRTGAGLAEATDFVERVARER